MTKNHQLAEWLELRIPYDAKGRNSIVEASCQQYLKECKSLKIVDLGAGTGANCRYYLSKTAQDQEWFLVEQNQELLEIAFDRIIVWAQENKYESQLQNSILILKNRAYKITIHRIVGSILDLENLIDLNTFDLAVANAVFDLFSEKQFQTLLECLKKYQLPLLATINYTGTHFIPQTEDDFYFVNYYHQHMQRPQYFGRGMGPDCGSFIGEAMKRIGMEVLQGESPWEISSSDPVFFQLFLNFMQESIPEILEEVTSQRKLNTWLLNKQQMIAQNKLSCNITHRDFWGYWK
jgi:SAM-dependent methyltransferase